MCGRAREREVEIEMFVSECKMDRNFKFNDVYFTPLHTIPSTQLFKKIIMKHQYSETTHSYIVSLYLCEYFQCMTVKGYLSELIFQSILDGKLAKTNCCLKNLTKLLL